MPLVRNRPTAFTLIELLVAIAVLAVLLIFFTQIVAWVGKSWIQGKQLADNLGKGRAAMDLITRDLQNGLFRPDLGAFALENGSPSPQSSNYCFFVARGGGGTRAVSLVNYRIGANATLQRQVLPVSLDNSAPETITFVTSNTIPEMAAINSADASSADLVGGVVAFQMYFINSWKDGHRSVDHFYTNSADVSTRAVGVAITVVDEPTQKRLAELGKFQELVSAWSSPPTTLDHGLGAYWKQVKDNFLAGTASANMPGVRTGIQVFESVVVLPVESPAK